MVVDALLAPLLSVVEWVLGLLPAGKALPLPNLTALWNLVAVADSIIPIMGPLLVGLGLLAFGAVFVVVRIVLTVWNLIYP